jgi:hypothetical protein
VQGHKSRGLAGAALLGAVGGILGALWLDRYAMSRRKVSPGHRRHAGPIPAAN